MDKNCLPEKKSELPPTSFIVKIGLFSVVVLGVVFTCSFFAVLVYSFFTDEQWVELSKEHASAVVGIPIATVSAFLLVSILQVTTGKVEFEGIGFKFRGASGPVVLWIACFIAMVISIKLLW
ncbi:MAG: hypothetical protein CEE38_19060 [Planctomycetes bacterium B3_Pla]|nr:MAG: hypothetical protein CEE38_19060 [Planctomycetes bacterium B3_Pla]